MMVKLAGDVHVELWIRAGVLRVSDGGALTNSGELS